MKREIMMRLENLCSKVILTHYPSHRSRVARNNMQLLGGIFLTLLLLFPPCVLAATYQGVVERVIDGDTIVIDGTTVRLIGIDTPETKHPDKPIQCFGQEASDYATERLEGKRVKYVTDEKYPAQDKYDRLLAYLRDSKGFFNADMIKKGYAFAYTRFPFKFEKRFVKYEKKAKKKLLGLWGQCEVTCENNKCETN